jgi:hypothetical protein
MIKNVLLALGAFITLI